MTIARTVAKEAVYGLASAIGLPRRAGAHRGAGLIVLTYHSVGPQAEHPYLNRMPPERFADQVRYLKAHYDVVPIGEGLTRIEAGEGPVPERSMVAITVDDGYADNYEHLYPIARQEGVPATIFLATDYLDSGELPWPTRIGALLHFATVDCCEVPDGSGGATPLPITTRAQKLAAGRALRDVLSRFDHDVRERALADLVRALAPRNMVTVPPLTWAQVREMQEGGVTFGSHTRYHAWLDRVSAGELASELEQAKVRIEAEIGCLCEGLAYPNGNHDAAVRAASGRAGYRYALTQQRGINRPFVVDPLALHRVEVPFNERLGTFACRVAGLAL